MMILLLPAKDLTVCHSSLVKTEYLKRVSIILKRSSTLLRTTSTLGCPMGGIQVHLVLNDGDSLNPSA